MENKTYELISKLKTLELVTESMAEQWRKLHEEIQAARREFESDLEND